MSWKFLEFNEGLRLLNFPKSTPHHSKFKSLIEGHWVMLRSHDVFSWYKEYMLTYKRFDDLICICYLDLDFTSCLDDKKLTSRYVFVMVWRVVK